LTSLIICYKRRIKMFMYSIFSGYIIPKGWKVLTWARAIHMDPTYYSNPVEFNPSRWNVSCILFFFWLNSLVVRNFILEMIRILKARPPIYIYIYTTIMQCHTNWNKVTGLWIVFFITRKTNTWKSIIFLNFFLMVNI
jgi:hypothetical protein